MCLNVKFAVSDLLVSTCGITKKPFYNKQKQPIFKCNPLQNHLKIILIIITKSYYFICGLTVKS